jgi:hypothetical protein
MMGVHSVLQGLSSLNAGGGLQQSPQLNPMSAHGPSAEQRGDALKEAVRRYPDLSTLPLAVTTGTGPYQSETYQPNDPENPMRGTLNVELRSRRSQDLSTLPDWIGFESIHGLQQQDPIYQQFHQAFARTLTSDQLANSKQAYKREKAQDPHGIGSFDDWLQNAQVPEYIRGYVFSDAVPGWVGPDGEGQYTSHQTALLNRLKQYLQRGNTQPLGGGQ